MDNSNQITVDAPGHNQEVQTANTQGNNLFQWSVELCRFLQDMKHVNDLVQNDSIKDKLTVIEWLRKLKANPKVWRLDSVKINQLEQLLMRAGMVF